MSAVYIDSFSGGAAELSKREQGDHMAVLRALCNDNRLSCFDRSEYPKLERPIQDLKKLQYIEELTEPYPWCRFFVTPTGLAALAAYRAALQGVKP